jgi:hypothetical protein
MPMGVDFICKQTTWTRSRRRCSEKAEMNNVQPAAGKGKS